MKTISKNRIVMLMAGGIILTASMMAHSGQTAAVIDDFSAADNTSYGLPRQFINDAMAGGATQDKHSLNNGIMRVTGTITPPRGQPGWSSAVVPLAEIGKFVDASVYQGIQLRVRITQGNLSVSANSQDITNFDYHAAPIVVKADGKFHDVTIPFASMKRAWSEQTPLNTSNLNSLSIVAYSLQPAAFDYEIDDVRFY